MDGRRRRNGDAATGRVRIPASPAISPRRFRGRHRAACMRAAVGRSSDSRVPDALASTSPAASRSAGSSAGGGFVPGYRCGAVPDWPRPSRAGVTGLPFSSLRWAQGTDGPQDSGVILSGQPEMLWPGQGLLWERPRSRTPLARKRAPTMRRWAALCRSDLVASALRAQARSHGARALQLAVGVTLEANALRAQARSHGARVLQQGAGALGLLWERPWSRTHFARRRAPTGRGLQPPRCSLARYSALCISIRREAVRSNAPTRRSPVYSACGAASAVQTRLTWLS